MKTIKLDITSDDALFIKNKQQEYSCAFRKVYRNAHLIKNKPFLKKLQVKFNLSSYECTCLTMDVSTKVEQVKTKLDNIAKDIVDAEKEINLLNSKSKLTKKQKLRLHHLKIKLT